jgi:ADP-ribosyl-[dinitrogen reductase] hydrolase
MAPIDPAAPYRIAAIETRLGGRIGLTPCPGTVRFPSARESWRHDIATDFDVIAAWGAAAVVTLVQAAELTRPTLDDLRAHTERRRMAWYHWPIRDMAVPSTDLEARWKDVGAPLRVLLGERRHVLLHCMGGLGRSGMVAARLLVELGEEPRTAIQRVRAARPGAIETAAQEAYVLACRAVEPGGA